MYMYAVLWKLLSFTEMKENDSAGKEKSINCGFVEL